MAFTVSDSNTRAEDMETSPTVADIGAGAGGGQETVTFLEGNASVSRKVTNSAERGTGVTTGATYDMTAAGDNRVWISKTFISDYLDLNSVGWRLSVGSATGDRYYYIIYDDGTLGDKDVAELFPRGGWVIRAVDPNVTAWRDGTVGTPALTAADTFCISCGLATGAAKAENIFIDAVDLGDGLYGVGSSADGTWSSFLNYDQGTNRIGHVFSNESGYEIRGKIIIGRDSAGSTATATVFNDTSALALVWPGDLTDTGWNELEWDLTNASTVITDNNKTYVGSEQLKSKYFFAADSQLDGTNNQIQFLLRTNDDYLKTGNLVTYSKEGGTATTGLTDGNTYFIRNTGGILAFYNTRADAYADTSRISLTGVSGTDESHSVANTIDTRPDFNVTGTGGTGNLDAATFLGFNEINLNSKITMTNCSFSNCGSMAPGGATLTGCVFRNHTTHEGTSFISISAANVANLSDLTFIADFDSISPSSRLFTGHALEITSGSGTVTLDNFSYTNYQEDIGWTPGKGIPFNTETEVNGAGTATIDKEPTGLAQYVPLLYSKRDPNDGTLGTEDIGLVDGRVYWVRSLVAGGFRVSESLYSAGSSHVVLTASTSGNGETHTFYPADAAIVNNTGNAITLAISGGDTPTVRNIGASTTTITNAVTVAVIVKDAADASNIQNARVFVEADTGGPLPAKDSVTITRSATTATVSHSGHGLLTSDEVVIRGANQEEYNGIHTITVVDANSYTFTVAGSPTTPATGTITSSAVVLNGLTNASGLIQNTGFSYTSDQPIIGKARKASASPYYKSGLISGTVTTDGFSNTVFLVGDE